jgi:hypothetical protein
MWLLLFIGLLLLAAYYLLVLRYPSFALDISPVRKAVFVTGAASGIGKTLCHKLIKEGAFVFACDLNEEGLKKEYENVPEESIKLIQLDVSKLEQIEKAAKTIKDTLTEAHHHGFVSTEKLFGVVNCAGVPALSKSALVEKTDQEMQTIFEVNVYGVARCTKALYPLMPHDCTGCIVNIASVCGEVALPYFSYYNASKFAVIGYTDTLRRELFDRIRVTCVEPGFTATPMVAFADELTKKQVQKSDFIDEMEVLRVKIFDRWIGSYLQTPVSVADALFSCLFSSNSPRHVMVDNILKRIMWTSSRWNWLLDNVLYFYVRSIKK